MLVLLIACDPDDDFYHQDPVYKYRLLNETDFELMIEYELSSTSGNIVLKVSPNSSILLIKEFVDVDTCPVFDFEKNNQMISVFKSLIITKDNQLSTKNYLDKNLWIFKKEKPCIGEYTLSIKDI